MKIRFHTFLFIDVMVIKMFFTLQAGKEVRGRLNVEELEGESPGKSLESNIEKSETKDKSAFNMFLKTMKDAGQLPEKPSPVVSKVSYTKQNLLCCDFYFKGIIFFLYFNF